MTQGKRTPRFLSLFTRVFAFFKKTKPKKEEPTPTTQTPTEALPKAA